MGHAQHQESTSNTLGDISSSLLALRDALLELSLSLQDLLFEIDHEERDKARTEFRAVFENVVANSRFDEFDGLARVPAASRISCHKNSPPLFGLQYPPLVRQEPGNQEEVRKACVQLHPGPTVPNF